MKDLPLDLLKIIFSFQEQWWLTNNRKLVNIEKLSQIPRPRRSLGSGATFYRVVLKDKYVLAVTAGNFEIQRKHHFPYKKYVSLDRRYWI